MRTLTARQRRRRVAVLMKLRRDRGVQTLAEIRAEHVLPVLETKEDE